MELSEKHLAETMKFIEEMEVRENEKLRILEKDLKNNSFILSSIEKLIDSDTKIVYFDSDTIFTSDEFDRLFSVLELTTDLTGTSYESSDRHFPTDFAVVLFGDYVVKIETMYGQGTMSSIEASLISESELSQEILENSLTLDFLLKNGPYLLENKDEIVEKINLLKELNENLNSINRIVESKSISLDSKTHLLKAAEHLKKSLVAQEADVKLI